MEKILIKRVILFLVLMILISCTSAELKQGNTQLANPASVYCEQQGGKLNITTANDGSQSGICTLKDGTKCDEWAYYRNECPKEKYMNTNPVDTLSDSLIQEISADCKDKKTDLEKSNCILNWQEKNIFWCYTHPEISTMPGAFEEGYPDCVVDMQFNQMLPGSFPVSKVITDKIKNGKIFGACYTYATTFCSIARWNGLKCRVMEVEIVVPRFYNASTGDYGVGYCGAAQKSYLDMLSLNCETWKKIDWKLSYDHYWAEVLIDGKWKIMEKSTWAYQRDTQKYIIDAGRTYKDTGW